MAGDQLLAISLVLVLGTVAQVAAWRLRIPSILFLLAAGLIVGPGFGWLHPEEMLGSFLEPIVALGVAILLFEGGLGLNVNGIRGQRRVVTRLITAGALISWLLAGFAAWWLLDFSVRAALVLGAILVVSGPTVVLPLLRHVRPSRTVDGVLRWEGILIDPIGALLAVVVFEATSPGQTWGTGLASLAIGLSVGAFVGWVGSRLFVFAERRYLVPDELVPALGLSLVIAAFVGSELIRPESGLVAATVMGVALANQRKVSVQHVLEFKGSLATILVASLFILLAAQVTREQIALIDGRAWLFLAAIILVIRPLMVFIVSIRSNLTWRERVFVGWMAPRGIVAAAVAALFALRLAEEDPAAAYFVPLTFLVIVGTVVTYGLSARPVARALKIAQPNPQGVLFLGINVISRRIAKVLGDEGFRCILVDDDPQSVTAARLDELEALKGNVLSTYLTDDLDMGGIGRMFAMTHNDATNSLASVHFTHEFTRAHVYQLADPDPEEEVHEDLRGRTLFSDEMTYRKLRHILNDPQWSIRRTPLTEQFGEDEHDAMHGDAIPLFLVRPGGDGPGLRTYTSDYAPEPLPGDTLVALVRERAPPAEPSG